MDLLGVVTWSNKLLDYLLEYRQQHPGFKFWLRQRDRGDRLSNGFWFQGNEGYIFLSFWNRSGGTNMTRSIGFVVGVAENGETSTAMEVVYNGEKDHELIKLYHQIISRYQLTKVHDTKYKSAFQEKDPVKGLQHFLDVVVPDIDSIFRAAGRDDLFITDEDFETSLNRVNAIRYHTRPIAGQNGNLSIWIALYKDLIAGKLTTLKYNELYKWETVQYFQNSWSDNISASNIVDLLKNSFNKETNNLWSGQNYLPYRMISLMAAREPATVASMFSDLFNEGVSLENRIESFKNSSSDLLKRTVPKAQSHYQDDRAVLVYLTLRFPERYYFFKSNMFEDFCQQTGFWEFTKKTKEAKYGKVLSFLEMCEKVREQLIKDEELLRLNESRLPASITFKDNFHVLTQDFIYAVSTYLKDHPDLRLVETSLLTTKDSTMNLNQIFFGPPGTGKTYHTVNEAIKIVDPDFYQANQSNRTKLKERFRDLLIKDWKGTHGQIAFCTFHQSFSYEDFVEGIKPMKPEEEATYLKYNIEDGVFKRICRLSEDDKKTNQLKTSRLISWNEETFKKAVFYKVSLGDANNAEDQAIYEYCINNNCIALGYGGPNDYSGLDEEQITSKYLGNKEESFAAKAINRFVHYLKVGNYVLISNGNHYIRAIGKVTGAYEYKPNTSIRYNHFRSVEWIVVNENIPISNLYDRVLSQQTIYKMDEDGIKKEFFVNVGQLAKENTKSEKNFVLIIDEINRGNVSSIFGELITLIEKDKRASGKPESEELEVTLPYSKETFKVPDNVYIIGTMNTADRSIEALDTALRRRFSFREMQSKPDLLMTEGSSKGKIGSIDLVQLLNTINQRIEKLIDKDHKIGHAYFMEDISEEELRNTFHNKVIPLLQEYFFGDFGKIGLVLGNSFVEKVNDSFDFAKFESYDSSVSTDLKERPVYRITTKEKWNFRSIYE